MPRRYKKKLTKRKPRYSLAKKLAFTKSPMPVKLRTKLRYCEKFTINPATAGINGAYVFRANDIYDPNYTSTGHQPRGFDQLIPMYDHFRVVYSKITIRAMTTDQTNPVLVGIALRDEGTAETDVIDYVEQGTVVSRTMGIAQGSQGVTCSLSCNPFKFLGLPTTSVDMRGTASASPTENAYYHVFASGLESVDVANILFLATIDYLVEFIEPKDLISS